MKKRFRRWRVINADWNALVLFGSIVVCIVCLVLMGSNLKHEKPKFESISKVEQYHSYYHSEWEQDSLSEVRFKYISLGEFKLTVYTPYCDEGKWDYQTATGVTSQHLMTCAVDPTIIPYGTEIIIREGNEELRLVAVDCGGSVKGNHIDIFYDNTEDVAIEWLMETFGYYAEVYIEKKIT